MKDENDEGCSLYGLVLRVGKRRLTSWCSGVVIREDVCVRYERIRDAGATLAPVTKAAGV